MKNSSSSGDEFNFKFKRFNTINHREKEEPKWIWEDVSHERPE